MEIDKAVKKKIREMLVKIFFIIICKANKSQDNNF